MAKDNFLASLRSLFNRPEYSDFTVTCNGRKWNVHKLVLCTQSNFFAKACHGAFKEAESGDVDLKDDPDIVNAMIEFFYTFEYNDKEVPDDERMPFAIRAFIIADKHDIEPLKEHAANRFRVLTEKAPCGDSFSRSVKLIYENTLDTGTHESKLRSIAVDCVWDRYRELMANDEGFKQVLDSVAGFGSDLVASQMRECSGFRPSSKRFQCHCVTCGFTFDIQTRSHASLAPIPMSQEDWACPHCGRRDLEDYGSY
ncbi:hypothetical protein EV356DRAFT_568953 [Viridothelium virens]|uniref:BTB domain-containing protein n=1 Tax=Viridothelium virens TaxID=1048519 RepID=A0A6A6H2P7_VIRVR|nr:hypothetical protein EV356DRAFT_568953 [Viridothelium virens]